MKGENFEMCPEYFRKYCMWLILKETAPYKYPHFFKSLHRQKKDKNINITPFPVKYTSKHLLWLQNMKAMLTDMVD